MKKPSAMAAALVAALCVSCVSSQNIGYSDGWVKTSTVEYSFTGPPLMDANNGQSYHVLVTGGVEAGAVELKSFRSNGMHCVADPGSASFLVNIEFAEVVQGEPGAMEIRDEWIPAFEVDVPYAIAIAQSNGGVLARRKGNHTEYLTFKGAQRFPTREQAMAAIDFAQTFGKEAAEEKAMQSACPRAIKDADKLAAALFKERNISMDVPVVRSAAGVEFEEAFEILADAENPNEVATAMDHYEREGLQQVKEDGSPNNTANYGVACGMAACHLMLGNLTEAWEMAKIALEYEPTGKEVNEIRRVIYQQEMITGERVIPEEDRKEIDAHMETANRLEKIFGKLQD